jgi:trimethylamine--corrinoid protein Co-methyltransferase
LYDRKGNLSAALEKNNVCFVPMPGCTDVWDTDTKTVRPAVSNDVVECLRLTDAMPNIAVQCSNYYPNDIPSDMTGYYRNFLALKYGTKPNWGSIVGTQDNVEGTLELMTVVRGSEQALREKPLMLFPTPPISPLQWDGPCFYQLKEFSLKGVPVVMVPSPTLGATAPITIIGSVAQCVAESLSGIVMSQLIFPGAPVVMGSYPQTMDMRYGTSCSAAMETFMANMACAEVAKYLNLPSHAITGFTDAKRPDVQSGFEVGLGLVLSALAGANLVEGLGGLGSCMNGSLEQLVIANEVAGMVFRLLEGITPRGERLAEDLFSERLFAGDHFLTSPVTMQWFKKEIHYPGKVVSREMVADWQSAGCKTAEERAREEVKRILETYEPDQLDPHLEKEMIKIVMDRAKKHGVSELPFMQTD